MRESPHSPPTSPPPPTAPRPRPLLSSRRRPLQGVWATWGLLQAGAAFRGRRLPLRADRHHGHRGGPQGRGPARANPGAAAAGAGAEKEGGPAVRTPCRPGQLCAAEQASLLPAAAEGTGAPVILAASPVVWALWRWPPGCTVAVAGPHALPAPRGTGAQTWPQKATPELGQVRRGRACRRQLAAGYRRQRRVSAAGARGIGEQCPLCWDANCPPSMGVVATPLMTDTSSENMCPQTTARPDQAPPLPSVLCRLVPPLPGHPRPVPDDGAADEPWGGRAVPPSGL